MVSFSSLVVALASLTTAAGYSKTSPLSTKPQHISSSAKTLTQEEAKNPMFLDTSTLPAKGGMADDELIYRTKKVLLSEFEQPDLFAEDFKFQAPIVGPLPKKDFFNAYNGFKIKDLIPDLIPQYHDFRVDLFEPNRVWFTSRTVGTHTGSAKGIKASGNKIEGGPETSSFTFNDEGKVTQFTTGYILDKQLGNTGGMGALFGLLYAMGSPLPFREAQPYKPSFRYKLFQKISTLASKFQSKK